MVDKLAASAKESDHDKIMNHVMLEETMNILEKDEKTIIEMRYFQEKTQSEVAKYWEYPRFRYHAWRKNFA